MAKFHQCMKLCECMLSRFSYVRLFAILWTVAHQVPLSMGFSRQEYWSGLPCPPPGDLPHPGIFPMSPASLALQVDSYAEPRKPKWNLVGHKGLHFNIPFLKVLLFFFKVKSLLLNMLGDLPSGPVLKNLPSNGGEECLIPGWGIKIAHATGQLSWSSQLLRPRASTREAHGLQRRPHMPQLRPNISLINVFFFNVQ